MLTALERRDFGDEVREHLRCRKAGDGPDGEIRIMYGVVDKYVQYEAVEIS